MSKATERIEQAIRDAEYLRLQSTMPLVTGSLFVDDLKAVLNAHDGLLDLLRQAVVEQCTCADCKEYLPSWYEPAKEAIAAGEGTV